MQNITMLGKDAVSAKLAECYVTIDGRRYNFMQMIDCEFNFEKGKIAISILGKTGVGNKATGWTGTFSGTMHYVQSVMRQLLVKYKDTGEDTYFDIQITNDDPTSAVGRQTMVFTGCNTDGGILAKFDANGDTLDESIDGTFEDFKMPEQFTLLPGM